MTTPVGTRILGTDGLHRLGARPRLHGHEPELRPRRPRGVDRHHPPCARPRRDVPRHLRRVRQRAQRGTGRRGDRRPARRGPAGHQVLDLARRQRHAHRRPAGERARLRRGQPAPAGRRRDRPVLPAPGRPDGADRGHRRRDGRPGPAGQGPLPRAVGGQRRLDPPRGRRPPDRGAAERVVAVDPRPGAGGAGRRAASTASASCRSARSAAASSPARSPARTQFGEDDFRRAIRASRRDVRRPTCGWSRPCGRWPRRRASRRGSWRWPGCWRRATDVVPIPGTKRRSYLEENVGAVAVELTADDLARLEEIAPPGVAAGSRYREHARPATARARRRGA